MNNHDKYTIEKRRGGENKDKGKRKITIKPNKWIKWITSVQRSTDLCPDKPPRVENYIKATATSVVARTVPPMAALWMKPALVPSDGGWSAEGPEDGGWSAEGPAGVGAVGEAAPGAVDGDGVSPLGDGVGLVPGAGDGADGAGDGDGVAVGGATEGAGVGVAVGETLGAPAGACAIHAVAKSAKSMVTLNPNDEAIVPEKAFFLCNELERWWWVLEIF